jgi:hypothetical protein
MLENILFHDNIIISKFSGELSVEFAAKIKAEADKQVAKDPWKETFFEDVWGFS